MNQHKIKQVAIIGGGPAGLMAAEVIAQAGYGVSVFDAMPSLGRKFLLAGVGGMNITHAEPYDNLLSRYASAQPFLKPFLDDFSTEQLREWIHGLGIETFVGSSGRVFPKDMKAAPLLRAWLHRLREKGVKFYPRHRWLGWHDAQNLRELSVAESSNGLVTQKNIHADALVFAMGGASWQRLGSDGAWVELLRQKNILVNSLLPSNCGFESQWSDTFQSQFAGQPLLTIGLSLTDINNQLHLVRGEAIVTKMGVEGTSIYALSAPLRELIIARGEAQLSIDLLPDYSLEKIIAQLNKPKGKNSTSNFLRKQLHLSPLKLALLRELTPMSIWHNIPALAQAIKTLTVTLTAFRPIDEAISSAGGVAFSALDSQLMIKHLPGVFVAGEMLDWEAPTGGYLLTACFATGRAAGFGAVNYLKMQTK